MQAAKPPFLRHQAYLLGFLLALLPGVAVAQFEFPSGMGDFQRGRSDKAEVTLSAKFTVAEADRPALLFVTATMADRYYVYAMDQPGLPDGGGPTPTRIKLADDTPVELIGAWLPTAPPKSKIDDMAFVGLELREHYDQVTWVAPINLPANVDPSEIEIKGSVSGQACTPETCQPFQQEFTARLGDGEQLPAGLTEALAKSNSAETTPSSELETTPAPLGGESSELSVPEVLVATKATARGSFLAILGLAFVGGLLLNVMPCVLPVIGLKVFAFIEQAGESRWKIFMLNLWFAVGVISVFMLLGVLSIVFQLGWGQLFQYAEFNIAMASVIFIMGLSFLGVWEIPIPGFIGTSKVTDIGRKEGYEGAFAKGTITTILATPCTGPFMGTALIGVLARPPVEILTIFFALGLGMASPYLLIGAFPQTVRFLPRPGEWMNTFKHVMGFVLIGTVVYLLTLLKPFYVVPTVALLFGLWLVCWWIGRVPVTAPSTRRWNALGEGIAMGTVIGLFAFLWLAPVMEHRFHRDADRVADARLEELLAAGGGDFTVRNEMWQPYSERKLQWLLDHGKTVLIDFTADWCPTCKVMERTVLKTEKMEAVFQENDIYTLVADWTHRDQSPEVTRKLQELGTQQIPLLAIYSARNPEDPILIPGTYTTAGLVAELQRAGPSLSVEKSSDVVTATPSSRMKTPTGLH